ncbi:MAG: ferredoxin [Candidatus Heimdallarchaeota archaeon]|nr:ferredoxin [Candidatus Heimdallarchaeota archaeon]
MSVQIYYFSGTGNSLHVAQELKRRVPNTNLVPIISALKKDQIVTEAEIVGMVFPIHAHTFPLVVKEFLQKVDFQFSSYIFALSTRLCAEKVFSDMNKILKRKGRTLDASFAVETPINYIPLFSVPTQEEVKKLELELQKRLDEIQPIITNKQTRYEKTGLLVALLAHTIFRVNTFLFQKTRYFGLEKAFYADDKCIGCGTCQEICLSNKINLVDKKPIWNDDIDCTFCFACISYCPVQAIQAKRKRTTKKGRYHHPAISAKDIAMQKQ